MGISAGGRAKAAVPEALQVQRVLCHWALVPVQNPPQPPDSRSTGEGLEPRAKPSLRFLSNHPSCCSSAMVPDTTDRRHLHCHAYLAAPRAALQVGHPRSQKCIGAPLQQRHFLFLSSTSPKPKPCKLLLTAPERRWKEKHWLMVFSW